MPVSQLGRDQSLLYMFGSPTATRTSAWYAALHSGFPGDAGSSFSNEITGTGYARQQLTGGNALILSAHNMTNSGVVTFTNTGGTAWTAFDWFSIIDASTSGALWGYGQVSQAGQSFFLGACNCSNPGSGYAVNDTITLTAGGGAILTVDQVETVNAVTGVPTQWHVSAHGSVASQPANPCATTTSGTGTGFTALALWLLEPTSIVLNSGDSYSFAANSMQIMLA